MKKKLDPPLVDFSKFQEDTNIIQTNDYEYKLIVFPVYEIIDGHHRWMGNEQLMYPPSAPAEADGWKREYLTMDGGSAVSIYKRKKK